MNQLFETIAPIRPPLWVQALCQRATDRLVAELGLPREAVWTKTVSWKGSALRRREAGRLYRAFPHITVLARELHRDLKPSDFRNWAITAGEVKVQRRVG